ARSEVFDRLLFNKIGESYEKQISFSKINSSGMEIILEYIYTGIVKDESLTKDNIVEAFIAADYFLLPDLQDFILENVRNTLLMNCKDNYSPELLSEIVDAMPLTEDNVLVNLLVEAVSTIPLNTIEFGRLSLTALQILLSCTFEKEKLFATPEYEVLRYGAILTARKISNDATRSLMNRLPILEQIDNFKQIDNEHIPDHQKTVLYEIRGVLQTSFDETKCGSKLIIEDNGKVVRAPNDVSTHQNVIAKFPLENNGIYEWDVIIEKHCSWAWVGVCTPENLNYEEFAGYQSAGWVLGSSGQTNHHSKQSISYCSPFKVDNSKVTVHLDMKKKTCAFSVNGTRYPVVSGWKNLPSKLYPVVSLINPGQFRIQLH
ncbi:2089_t:CDS:2, partial [Funneliformis geosporum]